MPSIRAVALCVFHRDGRILVGQGRDPVTGERFFRPIGGSIEFSERAAEAIRREVREELLAECKDLVLLGVLEQVFTYGNEPGHEVVFVFDAQFQDESLYAEPSLRVHEPGWEGEAVWISVEGRGEVPLYPEGLEQLLARAF